MPFHLPTLSYDFSALEPHIDAMTMEIHHGKHHQAYVSKLNRVVAGTDLDAMPIAEMLQNVSRHGDAVRNHGGGHYNHTLFWDILSPRGGGVPSGAFAEAIAQHFGSFEHFQQVFSTAASNRFGSGWAWLYVTYAGDLKICTTPNQDNPLMDVVPTVHRGTPLLGLDVWEHAYYLHYQHRRGDYIQAFWHLINWEAVTARYQQAL